MTIKRIKVKETKKYFDDFEGPLETIISSLQGELNDGWEGLEKEWEYDYGNSNPYIEYYLYKYREENDKEYAKRLKQLEKEKADKAKTKERKLQQLKKDIESLSASDKKLLGL